MGKIRFSEIVMFHTKRSNRRRHISTYSVAADVPKGHFAIYVGQGYEETKERFVIPISYLKHRLFQGLLARAEEEYGFDHHLAGGLTIPCSVKQFLHLTSVLKASS